jgi:signal transduction histidine kinase
MISSPPTLLPLAICWKHDPQLVWTMVVTNAIIFLSYAAICLTLFYISRRTRRLIARDWAYFVTGFALFLAACGATHLMGVVTTWTPAFWIGAWINIVTALLSAWMAMYLMRRARVFSEGINDYARRLAESEAENARMQESLLAARKLADWSRMSASVSHEIANPLESIQNLLYLVRHAEGTPPEAVEYARKAAEEATRVLTMARATLGFFRQSSVLEPVDLHDAAESVQFVLDSFLRERGVQLEIDASGDVTVNAQSGESRQVLLNLVRNAMEASTRGSVVTVTLSGDDMGVEITVADQGSGIDPALLPHLFHFGVTTKGRRGNGMGLWTARQIVLRHGGDIGVESEPGKGTRFTVWWPREPAPSAVELAAVPVAPHAPETARDAETES